MVGISTDHTHPKAGVNSGGFVVLKWVIEQKSRPITSRSLILRGNQSFPELPEGFPKKVNAFGGDTRSIG